MKGEQKQDSMVQLVEALYGPMNRGEEGDGEEKITKTNILWKPVSEKTGRLVVLFPYKAGSVQIKDAKTGKVVDVGRSHGPSNGYADTVYFNLPGSAFKDVVIEGKHIDDGTMRRNL
jgi:hypothetical protein